MIRKKQLSQEGVELKKIKYNFVPIKQLSYYLELLS